MRKPGHQRRNINRKLRARQRAKDHVMAELEQKLAAARSDVTVGRFTTVDSVTGRPITYPISEKSAVIFEMQREAFRKKFGRYPSGSDPVFFDPDADTPQPVDPAKHHEQTVAAMTAAGLRPEWIYAYRKTGRILTEETAARLPQWVQDEYRAAIREYFELHGNAA